MKGNLFVLLFLWMLLPGMRAGAHTFTAVDMQQVKAQVTDPSQPTYYPQLLKRFNAFDTTLTPQHYRLLYYGFVFIQGYNYMLSHREDDIRELIRNRKYREAAALCDSVLAKIPISLIANQLKASALYQLNNNDPKALPYRDRYRKLRDAILSSGDGFRCQSAFTVVLYEDRFDIIRHHFEIKQYVLKQAATPGPCDTYEMTASKYYNSPQICFHNLLFFDPVTGNKK